MATEPIDSVTGELDTEPDGLAPATAQQQAAFGWVADVTSTAMPEFGSMTAKGRHYPPHRPAKARLDGGVAPTRS